MNQMNQGDPTKGIAIASMVCGIISVVFCWFGYFAIVALALGIVAVILSVKAGKASPTGQRSGMAVAGLVLGIIGIVLSGIVFACALVACGSVGCAACAAGL